MKSINLEIKMDDLVLNEDEKKLKPQDMSKRYIELALNLYQAQPNERGQSRGLSVSEQRKIYKVLEALEGAGNVLELEDDWFNFLYKIFNEVKWVGGTKIVVRLADKLEEAKAGKEEPEEGAEEKPEKKKK